MENDLSSPRAHRGALAILILSWIIGGLWFFSGQTPHIHPYEQVHACGALAISAPVPYDAQMQDLSAFDRAFSLFSMKMAPEAIYDQRKIWPWRTLSVWFMERDLPPSLTARILKTARIWTMGTGLKFTETNSIENSDIRISVRDSRNRYASRIGKEARRKLKETSMWLYEIDKVGPDTFTRVVLHEFGHALGLLHELQSPENDIEWDSTEVYRYYRDEYNWDTTTVDEQILRKFYGLKQTAFDSTSIMIYGVPAKLTKNKKRSIPWPRVPSAKDIELVQKLYSKLTSDASK